MVANCSMRLKGLDMVEKKNVAFHLNCKFLII